MIKIRSKSQVEKIKHQYEELESKKINLEQNNKAYYLEVNKKVLLIKNTLSFRVTKEVVNSTLSGIVIEKDKFVEYLGSRNKVRWIKVKCIICQREREMPLKYFLKERPLDCYMCDCSKYKPNVDYTYLNTLRNNVIYIGKTSSFLKDNSIWVKCIECDNCYKLSGKDYLSSKYTCKHIDNVMDIGYKKRNVDYFKGETFIETLGIRKFKQSDIGIQHLSDIIVGQIRKYGNLYIEVECIYCRKHRDIPEYEMYSTVHTMAYKKCDCQLTDYDILLKKQHYVGCKFQKLTILDFKYKRENNGKKKGYVTTKCDCQAHTIKDFPYTSIISGRVKSCGCSRGDLRAEYTDKDYIGKVYNNLRVKSIYLRETYNYKNIYTIPWKCTCLLCGKDIITDSSLVVTDIVKDCGCSQPNYFTDYKVGDILPNGFKLMHIFKPTKNSILYSIECPICGDLMVRVASDAVKRNYGSCGCMLLSKGASIIKDFLESYKLRYTQELGFKDLGFQGRYDFGVYLDTKLYLIEYDGLQHFDRTETSKYNNYEDLHRRDLLKTEYAKNKGIPLLRVPYNWNKDRIIKELIIFLKLEES